MGEGEVMTEQYLMERGAATMNVTPDKLQEYLEAGWKVLKTPEENKHVVVTKPADSDELLALSQAVSVETTPPPAPPHQESADGDGSDASTAADAPAQRGVSVEEAVEKIGKRSRSKKG